MTSRRIFLKSALVSSSVAFASRDLFSKSIFNNDPKIACQQYTWFTYFQREGKSWMDNPEKSLNEFVQSGFKGYEPSFSEPQEVATLQRQMAAQKIWAKSIYVNSTLHEPMLAEQNIQDIIAIAREAQKIGVEIIVTNPTPIKWGGPENKSDEQLQAQAIALNLLGKELESIGIALAYHNHDAEMREGAREFHHMLTGTDPAFVKLCLDAHWIFRGSGNSQIALFDIVEIYADRIVELHLRQSQNGVWSETFGEGDINYSRLANILKEKGLNPHIVLEQAVENGTPHTLSSIEAMSESMKNAKVTFENFI